MPFQSNIIESRTIEEAWRDTMWCCVRNGHDYQVKQGSYKGQLRRQLEYLVIKIHEPWTRPLAVTLPEHLPFSAPTNEENIYKYFREYIIEDGSKSRQDYTYGKFIEKQFNKVIELLNASQGRTNQATMNIGEPIISQLQEPPCLRVIDFKVVKGTLVMSLFFRSWDLFAGLPENLGGLQLLKEYVRIWLNFLVEDGPIVIYSSGAHIYEQYFPIVNQLCVDQIEGVSE